MDATKPRSGFLDACRELNDFVNGWAPRNNLTANEYLHILVSAASQQTGMICQAERQAALVAEAQTLVIDHTKDALNPFAEAPRG